MHLGWRSQCLRGQAPSPPPGQPIHYSRRSSTIEAALPNTCRQAPHAALVAHLLKHWSHTCWIDMCTATAMMRNLASNSPLQRLEIKRETAFP
jgi:hypothetical protein